MEWNKINKIKQKIKVKILKVKLTSETYLSIPNKFQNH